MTEEKKEPDLVSGFKKVLIDEKYVNQSAIAGHTVSVDTYEETGIFIDAIPLKTLTERVDKLEHALITLASWVQSGEWAGAHEYIVAMLKVKDEV